MGYKEELEKHLTGNLPDPKHPFEPSPRAKELAAQIKDIDGPYAQVLKAIAEGKFYCAEEMLNKTQAFLDSKSNEINPWQTRIYVAYIVNACYAGRFQDALRWGDRLEPLVNDKLWLLTLLGQLYFKNGSYEKAESIMRRELEVAERSPDSTNANIAISMFNLAETLRMTNRLSEAETLCQRGMQIYEQTMRANHPKLVNFLLRLVVLYRTSGHVKKVKNTLKKIETICTKSVKEEHPDAVEALYYLAGWYEKANQLHKAKGLYKQALRIAKSRFGKDHPNVLKILEGLDRCRVGNKETREN